MISNSIPICFSLTIISTGKRVTAGILSAMTLMGGFLRKTLSAMAGTTFGVVIAGVLP